MKIVQLINRTSSQMMGFLAVTDSGSVIAVDGGNRGDTDGFYKRLCSLCAEVGRSPAVDFWFLTHPHHDHQEVFLELSQTPRPMDVGVVYYSPLPDSFVENGGNESLDLMELNAEMRITGFPVKELKKDARIRIDNTLEVQVLAVSNPDLTVNAFNNSSCVLRFEEKRRQGNGFVWLVLGDLGVEAGQRVLDSVPASLLRADAVQMAHHGQNGVEKAFYRAVRPRYAFWCTPDWLWTNTMPGGVPGEGPWQTLTVRKWMEEMNTAAIRPAEGDVMFITEDESWRELAETGTEAAQEPSGQTAGGDGEKEEIQ